MAERKTEDLPPIPDKRFFTIGEAAELVGVATSVLRFWEEEFKQLSPGRHGSRRRYERKDILKAREIRELLYDKGFTLAGAKKYLKRKKTDQKVRAAAEKGVLEELEDIRASIRDFLL
ncbi:MAG: MerR family transcriptional regulator [Mesosutterella sp.]|nr:MerR family transcriptional regulator [Mesosutterella sp.]